MLPAIVIAFGPVMLPVRLENQRPSVTLPMHIVPAVRLCMLDYQRPTDTMVKVDMSRQFADARPGWPLTIIIMARMEVKIDAGLRIVVVIVTIRPRFVVTGRMRTGCCTNDQQCGKDKQRNKAAHDGSPASLAGVKPNEYAFFASPVVKAYDCIAECELNREVGKRNIRNDGCRRPAASIWNQWAMR
jgi:hypothetical protein